MIAAFGVNMYFRIIKGVTGVEPKTLQRLLVSARIFKESISTNFWRGELVKLELLAQLSLKIRAVFG